MVVPWSENIVTTTSHSLGRETVREMSLEGCLHKCNVLLGKILYFTYKWESPNTLYQIKAYRASYQTAPRI